MLAAAPARSPVAVKARTRTVSNTVIAAPRLNGSLGLFVIPDSIRNLSLGRC
jgi:hypothetical protein